MKSPKIRPKKSRRPGPMPTPEIIHWWNTYQYLLAKAKRDIVSFEEFRSIYTFRHALHAIGWRDVVNLKV